VVAAIAMTLLIVAPWAPAADLWTGVGSSVTSPLYWQGITFDATARRFLFSGPTDGLWRTDAQLDYLDGRLFAIPWQVTRTVGWNHVGDLSFDAPPHRRLLVPLECYSPWAPDPNTCHLAGIGVVNPVTLAWRYSVALDPTEIAKAMWVEVSPDGRWVWTSSGLDLLAYDATQITPTTTTPLQAAKRLRGVLPTANVSGAAFFAGRLFLALDRGAVLQVQSYPIDPVTGDVGTPARLEIERTKSQTLHETEGLAVADALGGTLHWQIQPQLPWSGRIYHFVPAG
jgi:hypothetical protein